MKVRILLPEPKVENIAFYGFYIGRRGYLAYTFVKDQTKWQNESAVGVEVRNNTLYVPITQMVEYKTFNKSITRIPLPLK